MFGSDRNRPKDYRRAVVIDAGLKNTTNDDTLRSERRSALTKRLTEPTLLEMSGNPTNHPSGTRSSKENGSQDKPSPGGTDYFRICRHSGIIARNGHKSGLQTVRSRGWGWGSTRCHTLMRGYSTEGLRVTCAKGYSYLNATMGSTPIARRAGI
jgi:hypothetical protein